MTRSENSPLLTQYSRILVTGGAGFVGRHLVGALRSLGKEVVVLDNLSTTDFKTVLPDVTLAQADIREAEQVMEAAKAAELVFHLAANANGTVSVRNPRLHLETNTLGTFNVLEAALSRGAKRLVYVSSASVYGRPQRFPIDEEHPTKPFVPYGATKLGGELCCLAFAGTYGLPITIVRPFCVYGPGESPDLALVEVSRYLRWHLNGMPIRIVGDMARKTRDFVYVSDVVQAVLLLADKSDGCGVFNVGSGEEVSMQGLAEVIGSVTGRPAALLQISHVMEDSYRLVADISKIRALGYVPRVSLAEGVGQLVSELGDNPQLPTGETIFKRGQRAEGFDPWSL
ncbi:MAG: NAD-dependent epimerase/dehydratase family protein [Dehalococcoidia bacterium]|nr:NAD-dependent epimerase/dehydratase family protein [Dehalococcoidia bacterium]